MWDREWGPLEAELEALGLSYESAPKKNKVQNTCFHHGKTPAQVRQVPFAREPPSGSYWPVATQVGEGRCVAFSASDDAVVGRTGRRFLAGRGDGGRYHVGVDLTARAGDPI